MKILEDFAIFLPVLGYISHLIQNQTPPVHFRSFCFKSGRFHARSAPARFFSRPGTVVITLRRDDPPMSPARQCPGTILDLTSISHVQISFDKCKTRRAFQMLQTGKRAHHNFKTTSRSAPPVEQVSNLLARHGAAPE